ncbi:hypothetical protein [Fictibacillus solisalsi]|uniref:hypothetical protein n=1 Tax=Fictibacillus solisalsi TaxID=459525 RepID=UPI00147FBB96|nr:hypothetical protein [Fictibacillus solisalsi]
MTHYKGKMMMITGKFMAKRIEKFAKRRQLKESGMRSRKMGRFIMALVQTSAGKRA